MAGRLTPLVLPRVSSAANTTAPVLPAETKASALPSLIRLMPTTMEEFGLRLMAFMGCSLKSITCLASTMVMPVLLRAFSASLRSTLWRPTRTISTP